jgi:hypothetical protein
MSIFEFFVDFADASLLKQLGFDWDIPTCYKVNEKDAEVYMYHSPFNWNMPRDLYEKYGSDNLFHAYITENDKEIECISAPTLDVVQRWLREVHKLHITIFSSSQESWMFRITKPHQQLEDGIYGEDFETFEDAQDAAIKKCLEILK